MIDELTLAKMADMLSIASDQTRLKILLCLLGEDYRLGGKHRCALEGEMPQISKSVSEIIAFVGASQSLVSHQLRILKDAKLISSKKEGRNVYYSLSDAHVIELVEVVLEHVLEE
ncbi:MAG: metalloregulator ArsR/SmtB family transcription factor [Bacilli bacterium]|nr:metalloregulator ArsR/SmtB family transcription factor [Bacilli bacterium]